jgi:hypothetical protein
MSKDATWMGRPIEDLQTDELRVALKAAVRLLRSARPETFIRSDVDVRETPGRTIVGRTFNWAFIPAGHLWSNADRRDMQARLNAFGTHHGLQGAQIRFDRDRLEVDVPRRLEVEQLVALQGWLDAEKDALDVSQVP